MAVKLRYLYLLALDLTVVAYAKNKHIKRREFKQKMKNR